ncbi:hypothetical protein [Vibrio vulnificus]|uniref:hypothetical protein n=1 Tax=Vibrio vulnificus TaxID=672 RepID=UPI0032429D81
MSIHDQLKVSKMTPEKAVAIASKKVINALSRRGIKAGEPVESPLVNRVIRAVLNDLDLSHALTKNVFDLVKPSFKVKAIREPVDRVSISSF